MQPTIEGERGRRYGWTGLRRLTEVDRPGTRRCNLDLSAPFCINLLLYLSG